MCPSAMTVDRQRVVFSYTESCFARASAPRRPPVRSVGVSALLLR